MNKGLSLFLLFLLFYFFPIFLVSDDVGAAALVEGYLAFYYHLLYPCDRLLSVIELLSICVELLLQLLDLDVLLLDFGGKLLIVEIHGLLSAEILGLFDLRPTALGPRLEQVYGTAVRSYNIELVRKERNSVYLLLIMVDASNALAIAGSSSIIRSCLEATLSLRSRIFS